jgi:hypothetical protein
MSSEYDYILGKIILKTYSILIFLFQSDLIKYSMPYCIKQYGMAFRKAIWSIWWLRNFKQKKK